MKASQGVLILIILEVTLWVGEFTDKEGNVCGLNPYYTGSYSMSENMSDKEAINYLS